MPTYRFRIDFEAFENEHPDLPIEKYFRFLLGGFGYKLNSFERTLLYEEGGSDELNPCKKCGRCEGPIDQIFGDGKCICQTCRNKDKDDSGRKEWEAYLLELDSKGLRFDDVLGEVPK